MCRLVQALKESPMRSNQLYQGTSKITMAHDAIQAIKQLRRDVVEAMRSLMKLAKEKQTSGMLPICEDMITKTRILLSLWDPGLVEEALTFLEEYKVAKVQEDSTTSTTTSDDTLTLDFKVNQSLSPFKRITQQLNFDLRSPDFDDFVTPDTPECMQDIWSKSSIKNGEYAPISYSRNDAPNNNAGEGDVAEENFVIFPDVEDYPKQTEMEQTDENLQRNYDNEKKDNYDDEKEDLKNDADPCKRFLDTQKMCNSPSANYYKPTDEPEPWDLTQLNIEASVMCLVSKVKFLCGRCSSPAVRLRNKSSLSRSQSLKGCLPSNRHNAEVVTIQPKNGLKCEESNKLLDESNEQRQSSPGLEKPAFSKAKEGKKILINRFLVLDK